MLSKLASIFGLAVILMATVPVNSGSFWNNNGPCTPNLTAPGICNDNDGTLTWFDANGKKTPFSAMAGAQGPPGPAGAQGVTGLTGAQGIQGIQGIQGPPGVIKGSILTGTLSCSSTCTFTVTGIQ